MIGGLQWDFGDLDIKYLKKNISKCRSHISGSFRRTLRHCAKWLWNSLGKRYQRIRICPTREVETPSSPIRRQVPDPEKVERRKGDRLRVQGVEPLPLMTRSAHRYLEHSIRIPQEDTWRAPLSGLPQGEAHGTRDHHTPNDSISYPDMLSGSLTKVSKPCYVIPTACHSPRSTVLQWCVRTPCPDIFCHGFQRTLLNLGLLWWSKSYQNTKT